MDTAGSSVVGYAVEGARAMRAATTTATATATVTPDISTPPAKYSRLLWPDGSRKYMGRSKRDGSASTAEGCVGDNDAIEV